jgi:hypothetical protein
MALALLATLAACASRQVAHFDPGDADAALVEAVRAELASLGFKVHPVDRLAHEPGPDRVIYGQAVDIDAVSYRLHRVLGHLVQTAPTVRGSHFYSPRNMGVYLARAAVAEPREFSGLCGNHFARTLLWPGGVARIEIQAWNDERSGFLAESITLALWSETARLRIVAEDSNSTLAEVADPDPDSRHRPPLVLMFEPFDQGRRCALPERRVPEAIPIGGTHRHDADRL